MGIPAKELVRGFARGLLGVDVPPPAPSLFQLPPPNHSPYHPPAEPRNNSSGLVAMFEHIADANHPGHPLHPLAQELQTHHWTEQYDELIARVGEETRPRVESLIRGRILEQVEDHGVLFVHLIGAPPLSSSIDIRPSTPAA